MLIGNYFNDKKLLPCGICDNCINNKNLSISAEEFKLISDTIVTALKAQSSDAEMILKNFKPNKKQHVWTVINYLISEQIIYSNKEGWLILR